MKHVKISMVAIIAIITGLSLSAFTARPLVKSKPPTVHYYQFTGTSSSDAQIQAAGDWTDLGTGAPTLTCAQTSGLICYVEYDGNLAAYQTYVSNKTFTMLFNAGIIDEYRTS